jgi:hypothetical protein
MTRFALFVLLTLAVNHAWAQSTFGTILGSVRDPAGAAMVGVKVSIQNEATGVAKETLTDAAGTYEVTHLNPGLYTVTAESPGFQRHVHQSINLETGQILRIDIQMLVGQVTETVSVTAQAPLIESETATLSDVRTGRQMRELPLNFVRGDAFGGGIFKYMSLTPGSYRYEGSSAHSFAGTRGFQNGFLMDGTTLGDQGGGQVTPAQPSFESIQEMKLTMVNNSAEYGAVATITVTSKSGTNQLHGSAFQQYSTGSLNARNFFQSRRPFRVYNQLGGSLGGPVIRNRTFFFAAFEGNRNHTQTVFNSSVPTLALRRGDFSEVRDTRGALIPVRDPANNQPFPNNTIPASRFSSVSTRAQERFYQPPNFGAPTLLSQNLRAVVSNAPYWNHFDVRGDHRLNDRNSMYARFSWRNMPTPVPEGELPNTGLRNQLRKIRNGSLVDTHLFSPTVINEFRAGVAWHENFFHGPLRGLPLVRELGIRGLTTSLDLPGVPQIQITGFSAVTQIDYSRQQDMSYDLIDNVTFLRGRHSLKVGFNFRRNQASQLPIPVAIFGNYQFTGAFSGFSYADFLLGIPQITRRVTPQSRTYGRNSVYSAYAQDDFKLHPNLTLNLGLRYEWMNPFADRYDRMFNFDPATGYLVVPTETVLRRDISPLFPSSIRIVTADQTGFPRRGLRTADGNNFDPRLGLAWRPFGQARTVLRGGFGVFHNNLSSSTFRSLSNGGPFISNESFTNRVTNGVPLFQFPEPFLAVGSLGAQDITGVVTNLFNPYTLQWNLTAEQQVGANAVRLSYLGTRSINLLYRRNFNQPLPSTLPFDNNRRPYPQYRNITLVDNGGGTIYHALQAEAERKFARGLFFQAGWTWAKLLGYGIDSGEQGAVIENAYSRRAERGDEFYLMRHRFVASYLWELPIGPGRAWLASLQGPLAHVLGGWQFAGITLLQTGQRYTPSFSGRDPSNTNVVGGRPDRIANGSLPKSQRTIDRWFDPAAFVLPPVNAGRFGNSGIGVLEGPGTVNFDLGLFKIFRFRDNGRLEFHISTTNTLNHPNFRNPAANISAPASVGRISSLQGQDESGPRTVILGTRIEF